MRLFEVGRCFAKTHEAAPVSGYVQPQRVAALAWGSAAPEQWGQASRRVDFYDLKRDVEVLTLGRAEFRKGVHPALHPGRSAEILIEGKAVGYLGELHPALVQKYDLQAAPIVFELELDAVLQACVPAFAGLVRHQAAQRDLALVLDGRVSAQELLGVLSTARADIVRSVNIFDVYTGKGIESNQKSVALRIVLQHPERTLEEAEIEGAMQALLASAEQKLGARLRG